MATVNVNGIDLYYRDAGSGEPLLLIHGTGFNSDVWENVFDRLAQDYRTIAYDRRGYQRSKGSPAPTATYGEQQGDDAAGLLQALNAGPATLLGWSAGAIHALQAALRHPDCVKRLILYEPPLFVLRYLDLPFGIGFFKLKIQQTMGQRKAAATTFARMVLAYADGRNSYDTLSTEFRSRMAADADTLLAEIGGGPDGGLKAETLAAQIRTPVTLLTGADTLTTLKKTTRNLARILHDAPLVTLPSSNHLAMIDQPDEFVNAIREIMARG
jgi:pimeloyl-ACP methyl ester carboxylesterase